MAISTIINKLRGKKILILGFGKESASSYAFIRKHLPQIPLTIANKDQLADIAVFVNDPHVRLLTGKRYLDTINKYDIVLKSPGISLKHIVNFVDRDKISSQTDLFLQAFAPQCIGVTGTKGKSTTASFIYHVLNHLQMHTLLAGNIGIPPFDIVEDITPDTNIVLELSSHQLEFIHKSPHISILLNIFEEHLDHYNSLLDYMQAKFNIARFQSKKDYFINNTEDISTANLFKTNKIASQLVGFSLSANPWSAFYIKNHYFCRVENGKEKKICKITSDFPLKGEHNLVDTAAVLAAVSCVKNIDTSKIKEAIYSFKGLPHRLEFVGKFNGILFYNDSISTVPQSTIAAVQALKNVDALILGGLDREINYCPLIDFIRTTDIEHLFFIGEAGRKIMRLFSRHPEVKGYYYPSEKNYFFCTSYEQIVRIAKECTKKGSICLLSPAAASYDMFRNFEHRGDTFKELVRSRKKLDKKKKYGKVKRET